MSVLLMKLAGPMQSWGHESRYTQRDTGSEPTKSGVLGLLAAAQGRRRTDPIEDLVELRFGVRADQPGRVLEDFQTAHSMTTGKALPLTSRRYLADAVFVAGVEGEREFLEQLLVALKSPEYALFLGRRAFTPSAPIGIGIVDGPLRSVLAEHPWEASDWFKKRQIGQYQAQTTLDARAWESGSAEGPELVREDRVQDVPVSWDMNHREYAWRPVKRYWTRLADLGFAGGTDWMAAVL